MLCYVSGITEKQIYWVGSSKDELSAFPKVAKRKAGFHLRALHRLETIWFQAYEGCWKRRRGTPYQNKRCLPSFHVSRFEEAIYVLYAFQKKTQKTARQDIEIGKKAISRHGAV